MPITFWTTSVSPVSSGLSKMPYPHHPGRQPSVHTVHCPPEPR